MRGRVLIALSALAFASVSAAAALDWSGPGWYVIARTIGGDFLEKGPYADSDTCEDATPPNNDEEDYEYEYLRVRPDWLDG